MSDSIRLAFCEGKPPFAGLNRTPTFEKEEKFKICEWDSTSMIAANNNHHKQNKKQNHEKNINRNRIFAY